MRQRLLSPVVRIIDDEASVRKSESFLVRMSGWSVVEFESALAFLDNDDKDHPGCVILDIRMPGMSGLQLQDEMLRRDIDLPIIFLTGHGDVDMAVKSLLSGAVEFIVKPPEPERLSGAIRKAIERNIAERQKKLIRQEKLLLWEKLTPTEKRIAPFVATGEINKVIAQRQNVSEQAIKNSRSVIFHKLEVKNPVELNGFMRICGLLGENEQ